MFCQALEDIAYEGGDADTNGAVAGALLGCKLGKAGLPKIMVGGTGKSRLAEETDRNVSYS